MRSPATTTHPANLAARFFLELSALVILGIWGWHQRDDGFRLLAAVAVPLLAAALWGTFAVPDDRSRSGSAPVPIPGLLRLALELLFFGAAAFALYSLSFRTLTATFAIAIVVHYALWPDRIRWLAGQ